MRPALLALFWFGCSLGPPPGIHAPRAPVCGTVVQGIAGTWVHDRNAMEIRTDGTLLRDGVEGVLRWGSPGHAVIDVPGSHEPHAFGLMSPGQLLDVDPNGHSFLWTRVTIAPAYPEGCFAITGSLVGDWSDGAVTESFHADGSYERGPLHGRWSLPQPGYLDLMTQASVRRYRIALAAPGTLVSAYDGVVTDADPRGATLVETRVR